MAGARRRGAARLLGRRILSGARPMRNRAGLGANGDRRRQGVRSRRWKKGNRHLYRHQAVGGAGAGGSSSGRDVRNWKFIITQFILNCKEFLFGLGRSTRSGMTPRCPMDPCARADQAHRGAQGPGGRVSARVFRGVSRRGGRLMRRPKYGIGAGLELVRSARAHAGPVRPKLFLTMETGGA
jgi:hypothetical protein